MYAATVFFSALGIGLMLPFLAAEVEGKNSYCQYEQSCWPKDAELKAFSDSLDGFMITPNSFLYPSFYPINNRRIIQYPGIIVEVASEKDVVLSLQLARSHNIRVSVISTGHEYDGRNSGNSTLQLSFRAMKRKSLVDLGGGESAIRVETGNTWGDVHEFLFVNKRDKIAIGGADRTVGVAGWVLGGGHSPFSSLGGLGVDSALEFDMVLANGTTITANKDENTEIFWALRGGGGGTFGVVLNITFKLHDNPGLIQFVEQGFPLDESGYHALMVFSQWLSNASDKVSGYLLMGTSPTGTKGFLWLLLYRGSYEDFVKEGYVIGELGNVLAVSNFSDPYEFFAIAAADVGGTSIYIFNSLIGKEGLQSNKSLTEAFNYVNGDAVGSASRTCTGTILGGAVATAGKISGATAIAPGFRNGLMSMTCGSSWATPGDNSAAEKLADEAAASLDKYGNGQYYNEPQSNLPDWQTEFWGSDETYDRLLNVKKAVDPDYLFNCFHCVGYSD